MRQRDSSRVSPSTSPTIRFPFDLPYTELSLLGLVLTALSWSLSHSPSETARGIEFCSLTTHKRGVYTQKTVDPCGGMGVKTVETSAALRGAREP